MCSSDLHTCANTASADANGACTACTDTNALTCSDATTEVTCATGFQDADDCPACTVIANSHADAILDCTTASDESLTAAPVVGDAGYSGSNTLASLCAAGYFYTAGTPSTCTACVAPTCAQGYGVGEAATSSAALDLHCDGSDTVTAQLSSTGTDGACSACKNSASTSTNGSCQHTGTCTGGWDACDTASDGSCSGVGVCTPSPGRNLSSTPVPYVVRTHCPAAQNRSEEHTSELQSP